MAAFRKAVEINPNYGQATPNLGIDYTSMGTATPVAAPSDNGAGKAPDVHVQLGVAYKAKNLHDEAIKEFEAALALSPSRAEIYNNIGDIHYTRGHIAEAVAAFQKAVQTNPQLVEGYVNLGMVYATQGQLDAAIAVFKNALSLNPGFARVHFEMGLALYRKGSLEEAVASLSQALSINPHYADAHYQLGVVSYKQSRFDLAIQYLRRAIELDPSYSLNAEAALYLRVALAHKGRFGASIVQYKRAARLSPDNAGHFESMGRPYQKLGDL